MKINSLIILFFISISVFSQTTDEESNFEKNSRCKHRNQYSIDERNSFYPFNLSKKILLISFDDPEVLVNTLPVSNQILDSAKVKEIKILTKKDIENLTDTLYNYGYLNDKLPKIISEGNCYNPRNAILFLNEENKVIEYIEICFSCNRIEFSSEKIKAWDNCTEKNKLIKKFFSSMKIKVGTNLN